jgi:hypothetical protein
LSPLPFFACLSSRSRRGAKTVTRGEMDDDTDRLGPILLSEHIVAVDGVDSREWRTVRFISCRTEVGAGLQQRHVSRDVEVAAAAFQAFQGSRAESSRCSPTRCHVRLALVPCTFQTESPPCFLFPCFDNKYCKNTRRARSNPPSHDPYAASSRRSDSRWRRMLVGVVMRESAKASMVVRISHTRLHSIRP